MIHEHFRATGAYEAVQGLSDLFSFRLQNDDVQDFDVRWDQARLSADETRTDTVLEGLYKTKLQDSVQFQTVLALYDQDTARNNGKPNYSQFKTVVKLHIDQMMRTRNFRVRTEIVERRSVTNSEKGEKPTLRGKCESVSIGRRHMDNVPKETHVVSVMTKIASGNSGKGQRQKRRSSDGRRGTKPLTGIRQ